MSDNPAPDVISSTGTVAAPAVEAVDIEKSFGSTRALCGVSLQIANGQCVGLVGRNGAGKSTLVSILSGLLAPDSGQVRFEGQPAPVLKDVDAWRSRIAVVFQHSMVVPQLSVAENVFLGHRDAKGGFVDWRSLRERTQAILDEWGFEISAKALCSTLRVEERQVVEIARALATGPVACYWTNRPRRWNEAPSSGCLSASGSWWPAALPSFTFRITWKRCSKSARTLRCCATASLS